MSASENKGPSVDDIGGNTKSAAMDKYSRQAGAYGLNVMRYLRTANILVVGLRGVGVETAKDLILTGLHGVHVLESGNVEIADLGTNFFLQQEHVGKPRIECCLADLQELNEDVDVQAVQGDVAELLARKKDDGETFYDGVIVTDNTVPLDTLIAWNKAARAANSAFLLALTSGVMGVMFADFGDHHVVQDKDGEVLKFVAIQNITKEENDDGKLSFVVKLDENHDLDDGELIQFEDVVGIDELQKKEDGVSVAFKIRRFYHKYTDEKGNNRQRLVPDQLWLETGEADISAWGNYVKGGFIRERKTPVDMHFLSLEEAVVKGEVHHTDTMRGLPDFLGGKNAGQQVMLTQLALWRFQSKHDGRLPALHSSEEADEVVALAKEINAENKAKEGISVEEVDAEGVRKAALYAATETSGFSAFLGGAIAQEVIKKCGKWTPIKQWMATDSFAIVSDPAPEDAAPKGTRYDHQVALFGSAFQDKIMNQRWFLVGCGALGCEYMKAFALMGVGCGEKGLLQTTDMDTIEVSNLARQFLFRKRHVGKAKSVCAAETARKMNPDMKIKVFEMKVAPDTENVFGEEFWEDLDGVCNALDNVAARLYMDRRCVLFRRPLLESGTLGTKANNDVIVPHKTQSFSDGHVEVKEKFVPQCTMKNFPYMIEHTIGWAGKAGEFHNLFVSPASDLEAYTKDPERFFKQLTRSGSPGEHAMRLANMQALADATAKGVNMETCVRLAFEHFIEMYRDKILDLIHFFPEDAMKKDKDSGKEVPFWSAPKRFPQAVEWDKSNVRQEYFDYLYNTANLYAFMFGVEHVRDEVEFKKLLDSLALDAPEWSPPKNKSGLGELEEAPAAAEGDDEAAASSSSGAAASSSGDDEDPTAKFNEAKAKLAATDLSHLKVVRPADFEKDDDTNFHIDFVTSASNLRASNYHIPMADRHKTKMTAGNIIPAIATTTAMITGLNSIEFYKVLMGLELEAFSNSNVNLGVAQFSQFEPTPPKKAEKVYDVMEMCDVVPVPDAFTCWDQVVWDHGDVTVDEFIARFPEVHHGCVPTNIEAFGIKKGEDEETEGSTPFIYLGFAPTAGTRAKNEAHKSMKISEVFAKEYGALPASGRSILLQVSCERDDEPVLIPNPVIYRFK